MLRLRARLSASSYLRGPATPIGINWLKPGRIHPWLLWPRLQLQVAAVVGEGAGGAPHLPAIMPRLTLLFQLLQPMLLQWPIQTVLKPRVLVADAAREVGAAVVVFL